MTTVYHKKAFGQHFLHNPYIIAQIVDLADDLSHKTVIEIGPGDGALTKELLKYAKQVIAIEKDQDLMPYLRQLQQQYHNFDYIIDDALHFDVGALQVDNKVLISNLPYNVGTKIYTNYLTQGNDFDYFILMFQLEVAKRIVAQVGDKHYGRLALLSQFYGSCELVLEVAREHFLPPPLVDSAVIKVTDLNTKKYDIDIAVFAKVTQLLFSNRRKMLRKILANYHINWDSIGLDNTKRPEELSIDNIIQLIYQLSI